MQLQDQPIANCEECGVVIPVEHALCQACDFDLNGTGETEVSSTLANLLLVEDFFIWMRDGNRVRRYCHEVWPEWLDNPIEQTRPVKPDFGFYALSHAWMIQHCDRDYCYETRDDGTYITPEDFLAGRF